MPPTRHHLDQVSSQVGFSNYEQGVANFKHDVPEFFNFASDVIDRWAVSEEVSTFFNRLYNYNIEMELAIFNFDQSFLMYNSNCGRSPK